MEKVKYLKFTRILSLSTRRFSLAESSTNLRVQTPGRLIRVSTFVRWLYTLHFSPRSTKRARKGRARMQTQRPRPKRAVQEEGFARLSASTACVPFVDSPGAISLARRAFPRHGNAESPITSRQKRKASPLRPRWRAPRTLCYFSYSLLFFFFFLLLPPWKYYELDCIGW